jgi:enoyl-CoA hydratase/carnithine racemase
MTEAIGPVVRMEHDGRVARMVIGSGLRRNALRSSGWVGIERAVHRLAAVDGLRAVIVEGAAGWFCAGSDIREWVRATPEQVELSFSRMESACAAIEELAVPVIAKVRGPAAGAGCQLALACDLRVLADNASIGMPIAWLGILVSPMFANRLAAHGGAAVAGDLLYTGRMVGAREAVTLGMANVCVPGDDLDRHVEIVIAAIMGASDASIRAVKISLRSLASPARVAARAPASRPAASDEDFRRRVNAFVQGRRPLAVRLAT